MARAKREVSKDGFYHVLMKSTYDIFESKQDINAFMHIFNEYTRTESSIKAAAFAENHVHLFIENHQGNLGITIKPAITAFARYYNRVHGLHGAIFSDRFKSEPINIEQTEQLLYFMQKYHKVFISEMQYETPNSSVLFADYYRELSEDELFERIYDTIGISKADILMTPAKYTPELRQLAIPMAAINKFLPAKIRSTYAGSDHKKRLSSDIAHIEQDNPVKSIAKADDKIDSEQTGIQPAKKSSKKKLNIWLL